MSQAAFLTFIVAIAAVLGILIGMLRYRGIGLGIGGVLFSGILVGHFAHQWFGLTVRTAGGLTVQGSILGYVQEFGLILFVYAIGIQVGPSFFASLRSVGAKLISWVILMIVMGCSIALALHFCGMISVDAMVGIYSGAITNTPALGAATQMIHDMAAVLGNQPLDPKALGFDELVVPSAYAMAYPFGVLGLLMTMVLIRLIFRVNIDAEYEKYAASKNDGRPDITDINVAVRNQQFIGSNVHDIPGVKEGEVIVSRVKRGDELLVPTDIIIEKGDILHVVGAPDSVGKFVKLLGKASEANLTTHGTNIAVQRLAVTNPQLYGKALGSLHLEERFNVVVSRFIRTGVQFIPAPHMKLQFGDIINVVGTPEDIKEAGRVVGNSTTEMHKVRMLPIFICLALGVLLGNIPISISGVPAPLKLGLAGGPLVMAIILSRFGEALTFNRMHWHMPVAGLSALRETGITLFLAIVGINAGASGFWETLTQGPGFTWLCLGVLITFIPAFTVGVLAYKLSRINYLVLCGMLAGGVTNPPALAFANNLHSNSEPASLGYATVYPLTMFLRILSPQVMIIIAVLVSGL